MRIKKRAAILFASICLATAAVPATVYAADPDQVSDMIELLPGSEEEITSEAAKEIGEAMQSYEELTLAERLKVVNYEKLQNLYKKAQKAGYLKQEGDSVSSEEKRTSEEQQRLTPSNETETGVTEYVFTISDINKQTSIVVHYITDRNGDNVGDIPSRIVLTSPKGTTTPLSNSNSGLKDDTMDISLTWEESFVQLDVAHAENGKWKITSSDPVTIRTMPYAGIQQEIVANDDKTQEDADIQPAESEQKKGPGIFTIVTTIGLIGVLIYLTKRYFLNGTGKSSDKGKTKKKKEAPEEPVKEEMSNEEFYAQMKQKYGSQDYEEDDDEYEDLDDEDEEYDDIDEYDDMDIREYEEGETGVLKRTDNPVLSGGGYRDDGYEEDDHADDDRQQDEKNSTISSDMMKLIEDM